MASESLEIAHIVRRMRGGSQSFLVEGADHHFYVAKFSDNPQGNRTLINEWIGHWFLENLRVPVPPIRTLRLNGRTTGRDQLWFQTGGGALPISGEVHLGSRVPVDPRSTAIFDFLPRTLLPKVSNLAEFARTYVIDKWLGQTDSRQAVFVRERRGSPDLSFKAYFIDHGMLFGGNQWRFVDSDLNGIYFDRTVYAGIDMEALCRQTMQELSRLTISDFEARIDTVPTSWFDADDRIALRGLLMQLLNRQKRLPELILASFAGKFPCRSCGFQAPRTAEARKRTQAFRGETILRTLNVPFCVDDLPL